MKTLYESLKEVKDPRRAQGIRTPLAAFLEMIILAEMSGNYSIRSVSRFIDRNRTFFSQRYELATTPSYGTLRDLLKILDYKVLNNVLRDWCSQFMSEQDWIAIDGKAIKSTVTNKQDAAQNYLSMVSMFCSKRNIVLDTQGFENKKEHEIKTARDLINDCELKGVTFTMDALHCQKKQSKISWSQEMTM